MLVADDCVAIAQAEGSEAPLPTGLDRKTVQVAMSGKLQVLIGMLAYIRREKLPDRWVIVSNYTQTLDLLAQLLTEFKWGFFQLDGSTNVQRRQEYVDRFNGGENYVFLLSSKAGGTGINLIGANRLVLFDPDW